MSFWSGVFFLGFGFDIFASGGGAITLGFFATGASLCSSWAGRFCCTDCFAA